MTLFHSAGQTTSQPAIVLFWSKVRSAFETLRTRQGAMFAKRRAVQEISQMEDWQLRDIGLNRGDVERLMHLHGVAARRRDQSYHRLHL